MAHPSNSAPVRRPRGRRTALSLLVAGAVAAGTLGLAAPAGSATPPAPVSGCAANNRFGFLLPGLATATASTAELSSVAATITETTHLETVGNNPKGGRSDDESDIDAGYTYAGQFIDHDIVLDPRPDTLTGRVDPSTLINRRTPQLDLDSLYGSGPQKTPQLYQSDKMHLKVGVLQTGSASDPKPRDLPRNAAGVALIGDARNDENLIVGSLHSLMIRFHNKIVDDVRAQRPAWTNAQVFVEARKQVTWYYQWAVLSDFLPQMSSKKDVDDVAKREKEAWRTTLRFYDACRGSMPVEFSAAAYRWHTMVRDDYVVNDTVSGLPVFSNTGASLVGFRRAPRTFGFDWDFYFSGGARKAQKAYKFDNSLVPALGILPGGAAGSGPVNLSVRNLLRGAQLGLPSGQAVARAVGSKLLRDDEVIVGPALGEGAPTRSLVSFSPTFAGNAPLWVYLAAESVNAAYKVDRGVITKGSTDKLRLGPTGALIVNETMVGLMANDPASVLNHPEFTPDPGLGAKKDQFGFRDIIRVATSPDQPPCVPGAPPAKPDRCKEPAPVLTRIYG